MKNLRGILLLEGADAAGKSTLARYLVDKYNARYIHSTYHSRDKIWKWHLAALRRACKLADNHLVILDRHWISECIYGGERAGLTAYRDASAYTAAGRCFDRVLMKHGALYVICTPNDLKRQIQRHADARALGKEMFSRIDSVAAIYYDLVRGSVAHHGANYVDQLVRWGDFTQRSDVIVYDLDEDGKNLQRYSERLLSRLALVRFRQIPGALAYNRSNLLGSVAGATRVFVGDTVSPNHLPGYPWWPFFAPDTDTGSAGYLNKALHDLKLNETKVVWTNGNNYEDPWLKELAQLPQLKFVALGANASGACERAGIEVYKHVPHPQYWKRFKYDDLVGYTLKLREAMR